MSRPPLTRPQQELFDWLLEYMGEQELCPSIREMVEAMGLKSTSGIQNRLKHLHEKRYILWLKEDKVNKKRTRIRILPTAVPKTSEFGTKGISPQQLPILGAIAAGNLVEPFTDYLEYLNLSELFLGAEYFALRVTGNSMIEDHIVDGDTVIMKKVTEPDSIRNGTIVAAMVEGETTLKRFLREGDRITLQPANPAYKSIVVNAEQLEVQGMLVGIWRLWNS